MYDENTPYNRSVTCNRGPESVTMNLYLSVSIAYRLFILTYHRIVSFIGNYLKPWV